jgi:hypothetical protein
MSDKIDDGGPAYPVQPDCGMDEVGMSLRDRFAIAVLPELFAVGMRQGDGDFLGTCTTAAHASYLMADEMLLARKAQR